MASIDDLIALKIDYGYEISDERIRTYLEIPEIERLRWLEEICVFTNIFRQAPTVARAGPATPAQGWLRPALAGRDNAR